MIKTSKQDQYLAVLLSIVVSLIAFESQNVGLFIVVAVFGLIWLISEVYFYAKLGYMILRYGREGQPDPPADFESRMHLPMAWFVPMAIGLLLLSAFLFQNWWLVLLAFGLALLLFYRYRWRYLSENS
ncbi:hypothetical protein ACNAN0_04520 [Agrilactobacillus fermenti]|uniref:hypothetical protein n=1 Tax=Agrilactobacillus fermenti TaxID=2586909 RepID=UPI001E429FF8|nr:hypothetical protein [Agrilactobacillus fermenti]MCD2256737.1 hypothetical protein [Agrilactobacillus fermenti]